MISGRTQQFPSHYEKPQSPHLRNRLQEYLRAFAVVVHIHGRRSKIFCEGTTLDFRVGKTLRGMKWYLDEVGGNVGGLNG
ncbi:MAG: hypothetical protein ACT6FE_06140 [Methanosarcinaceae archaeon]